MTSQKTNFKYKGVDLADLIEIESFTQTVGGKYTFTHKTATSDFKKNVSDIYYYINSQDIGKTAHVSASLINSYSVSSQPTAIPTNAKKVRYYMRSGSGGGGGGGGYCAVLSTGQENFGWFGGEGGGSGLIGGEIDIPTDTTSFKTTIGSGGPGGPGGAQKVNDNWSPNEVYRDSSAGGPGTAGGNTSIQLLNTTGGVVSQVIVNGGLGGNGGPGVRVNKGTGGNQSAADQYVLATSGANGPRLAPATWTEISNVNGGSRGARGTYNKFPAGGPGTGGYAMLVWLK
jgi:hypothetical protein